MCNICIFTYGRSPPNNIYLCEYVYLEMSVGVGSVRPPHCSPPPPLQYYTYLFI